MRAEELRQRKEAQLNRVKELREKVNEEYMAASMIFCSNQFMTPFRRQSCLNHLFLGASERAIMTLDPQCMILSTALADPRWISSVPLRW